MVISIEEISISVSIPSLIKDFFIRSGKFSVLDNGYYEMSTGGFSVVFPVIVGDEKWAFRCWHVTIDKAMERYKLLSQTLPLYKLPYFVDFYYEEQGIVVSGITYPTIRMRWVNGKNIKDYIGSNLNDNEKIFRLADRFLKMIRVLHKSSIAHGDLQHENIMVNSRGNLVLIDYDSLFIPELRGIADEDIIAGKPDYQHPCRKKNKTASPKIDYFSEVVILLGILGIAKDRTLWEKYHVAGSDGLLFSREDYYDLKKSKIYSDLYRFGHPFSDLLDILCTYLKSTDINQLVPLESFDFFAEESFDIMQYYEIQIAQEKKASEIIEKDNGAWRSACSVGTVQSYQKYLRHFPSGVHVMDAKMRIEKIYWDKAKKVDNIELYQSTLTRYPDGMYARYAINRINHLKAELESWNKAIKENTIDSYNAYLNKYPNDKHRNEANKKIKLLTEQLKRRKRVRRVAICCVLVTSSALFGPPIVKYANQYFFEDTVKESPVVQQADVTVKEGELEAVIAAMERTKELGYSVNTCLRKKAEELLHELKSMDSTRYDELNRRYNNL